MGNNLSTIPEYIDKLIETYGKTVANTFGMQQQGGDITAIGFFSMLVFFIIAYTITYVLLNEATKKLNLFSEDMRKKLTIVLSFAIALFGTVVAPLSSAFIPIMLAFYSISIFLVSYLLMVTIVGVILKQNIEGKTKILVSIISIILGAVFIIYYGFMGGGSAPASSGASSGEGFNFLPWITLLIFVVILAIMLKADVILKYLGERISPSLSSAVDVGNIRGEEDALRVLKDLEERINHLMEEIEKI